MGVGKMFPGGVTHSGEFAFYQLETKEKKVFNLKVNRTMSNFKIQVGPWALPPCLPPSDAHALLSSGLLTFPVNVTARARPTNSRG